MNSNAKDLVEQSMEIDNDFSSSTHAINVLAKEIKPHFTKYEIPSRYNKDTLRIISVNTSTYYIYWEVSDNTLKNYSLDLHKNNLQFIVKDENSNELCRFESPFALGEHYLNKNFENMNICVKVEIEYGNNQVEIMSSNMIHTFSSKINFPDKNSEVWVKRIDSWSEVIDSSFNGFGMSSDKYLKELKRIKHFTQIEEQKASSSTMIKEI
jgi:uncharacterized protein